MPFPISDYDEGIEYEDDESYCCDDDYEEEEEEEGSEIEYEHEQIDYDSDDYEEEECARGGRFRETEWEDEEIDSSDEEDDEGGGGGHESEYEDEEIDSPDEAGQYYDETEDDEVVLPNVPVRIFRSHNLVNLLASSSNALVPNAEEEATYEGERQDREEPPSSQGNQNELFCPICMEALTNEGDHHIW